MFQKLKGLAYHLLLTYRYVSGKAKIYHQGTAKSRFGILRELLAWQVREHDFNSMYYAMGLNLAGSRQENYIGRKEFLKLKTKVEQKLKSRAGCQKLDYDVVTKDKFIANSLFFANNLPSILNVALYCNSKLIFRDGQQTDIYGFRKFKEGFIIKNTVLEAGDGVLVCRLAEDKIVVNGNQLTFESFTDLLNYQVWVVQLLYVSARELRKINATALNTTRIVTILNGTEPEYLSGFQAFATNGATTDSWSKGSVYVGIDIENECLKGSGYCNLSDKEKGLITQHPDSGVVFDGYKIPGLREAAELCLKAHRLLYFNFAIGWDIAITDDGSVIVEANEKPGMNVAQCTDEGARKRIQQLAAKYLG